MVFSPSTEYGSWTVELNPVIRTLLVPRVHESIVELSSTLVCTTEENRVELSLFHNFSNISSIINMSMVTVSGSP